MAIIQWPQGGELLVVGYFNTNLFAPEWQARDEDIAAVMAAAGTEDLSGHFLPLQKPWLTDSRTWCMCRGGHEVHSWTKYIMDIDQYLLQNVVVHDACHNIDHYLVLGCLCRAAPNAHLR